MKQHREIESVSPKVHVQMRPYVYAGSCADATHLMIELLGNSIDEYNVGYGNEIYLTIDNSLKKYSISDSGRGFPVNEMREDGETTLQASFDTLNTSGKFRNDGTYSGVSIGKNGQGGKIANFLSDTFDVLSWRSGKSEHVWFKDGDFVKSELDEDFAAKSNSGTIIHLVPSDKYFDSATINLKRIEQFCDDITCLCNGLAIFVNDKKFYHQNGISDMLTKHVGKNVPIITKNIFGSFEEDKQKMKFGITYTSSTKSEIVAYVNCGETENGVHISAIKSGITRALNSWARENNFLKEKDKNLSGQSLQEGLVFVANITAENVEYDAQIKSTITKIDTAFISQFTKYLILWLDNNPQEGKAIIEHAMLSAKAAEAVKRARAAVKNKKKRSNNFLKMPTSLSDCWSKDRSICELYLTEGRSASSNMVAGRDSKFQAVYGVRGKMLSVLKAKPETIIKNQEINNLIQALGLEFDPKTAKCKYDKKSLRYGKIITATDADFDGEAISNLMLNIFWYICPELIINGHIYCSEPPLFRVITKKNEYIYLKNDIALQKYKEKYSSKIKAITRMKGLGEQDANELAYCLLEPETRNMKLLTVSDMEKTADMFNDLYGKKVEPRVKFLEQHLEEANIG